MKTNAAGDIFLTGDFMGTVDVDPSSGTANLVSMGTYTDVYLAKYSSAGDYVWAKALSGNNTDVATSIALDPQGNVLVAFEFQGTLDMDPSPAVANISSSYSGDTDMAFAKYDGSGNYLWGGSIGVGSLYQDGIYTIRTDATSNVYIAGTYGGTVDFDITSGVLNRTQSAGYNGFWAKYTSSGNVVWVNEITGGGPKPSAMAINGAGTEITLVGDFGTQADMDYSAGVYEITGTGSYSGFIAKYSGNCIATTSSISVTACSSYIVPSGDETHSVSGTYMDTIPNAANCDSIITINLTIGDAVAPVASTPTLTNVTGQCSVTTLTAPTATDNCAGPITGTHNATLPITAQGTTVVTWTYNDGNGNTSTQTQNVIISDNTAPVANTANLADVTEQCLVTSLTAPTATDNCAGTITGTHNATLPITSQGTTVVTWTYNDGNGNTSTQTQNVIINNNTVPVANTANLSNVTAQCSVTSLTAPTATDNCGGKITGTHNATLPITTQGTTIVTWTYNDGNGNTSTQTQNVIVTLPVSTTTLSGLTISATTSGATYQWINCGTGNTPIAGATSQSFTATANGTYAVIVTQSGCSATSACVAISTVGLDEISQTLFTVYPNPNNGTFKVVTELQVNIQITNTAGQLISTQMLEPGESIIELVNAESGIYFLTATDSNGQSTVQRVSIIK
ncbi:T9SS type A sorting domain-containing protein [Fluviicola taffensis]|nr:T9SS type A sorting domain-containing protein [Fluviicola taffensis]